MNNKFDDNFVLLLLSLVTRVKSLRRMFLKLLSLKSKVNMQSCCLDLSWCFLSKTKLRLLFSTANRIFRCKWAFLSEFTILFIHPILHLSFLSLETKHSRRCLLLICFFCRHYSFFILKNKCVKLKMLSFRFSCSLL